MKPLPFPPRPGRWSIVGGVLLASILAGPAARGLAQEPTAPPLARYVPAESLAVLIEHDGLETQSAAWKGTATYRMLTETSLGAMLDDMATQLLNLAVAKVPGQVASGKDVLDLLKHLVNRGFVIGYCGTLNPPQPRAGVLVIREAADNPTFKRVIAQIPPLNEPAATKVVEGKRTVFVLDGPPIRWWYEGKDFVFSFAPPNNPDPVVETLDGTTPSAVQHPARVALAQAEMGDVPVGRLFLDIAALPPLPPDAAKLGLDTIKRVDARWSIRGKAVSAALAVQAPRPRRGLLALFDQPPIASGTALKLPEGLTDYSLLAVDPVKSVDTILAMMKEQDPNSVAKLAEAADRFRKQSGLSLRTDLLAKLGPRAVVYAPGGGSSLNIISMWFSPPDFSAVIELKDPAGFAANLDRLMEWANRELRNLGALVPAPPDAPAARPGTSYAEFRRLKGAERGYTLAVPPAALPTPAGLRPTLIVDPARKLLAIGGSPAAARRGLGSLVLNGPVPTKPESRPGEFVRVEADPSGSLPQLLASLPSLVQLAAFAAAQQNGPAGPRPKAPPFRLAIDPDSIPEAGALRPFLFPTRFALANDDASIRLTLDMAFPLPIPSLTSGAEVPVLIALLLPAVQAAREAARRAQCVNNLKQIGLGMHNFSFVTGSFPGAAILSKDGKPLLSWRVAILPYIEQDALYQKFKLDEPWDSPTNKALIPLMPTTFSCPSRPAEVISGMTPYRVFTSPGSLFDAATPAPTLASVTDGTSNTLAVVEAGEAVLWTQPEGLKATKVGNATGSSLFDAGSKHPGGFNALFADGSVRFIKLTINSQVFQALISRAGGEVVGADSY